MTWNENPKRYEVVVVDIISTIMLEHPIQLQGDLGVRRKVYGASDPELYMGEIYDTSGETLLSRPEKIDRLLYR